MASAGNLAADLKGCMATHLSKIYLHQLERLGAILNHGWAHPENPSRPPPIPNKHPSTSPRLVPTENSQGNPHPIPQATAHTLFQPLARLDRRVRFHQEISNQSPNHIAHLGSNSKISLETSMARPEHVTNYRSSLVPTPQLPRKATPPRLEPPPTVEHPATPRRSPQLAAQHSKKKIQRSHPRTIREARRR